MTSASFLGIRNFDAGTAIGVGVGIGVDPGRRLRWLMLAVNADPDSDSDPENYSVSNEGSFWRAKSVAFRAA